MNEEKKCPFNQSQCTKECALYIDPSDLNEVVRNKLASLGVIERDKGICAFKNMSLCMSRYIFENNSTRTSR